MDSEPFRWVQRYSGRGHAYWVVERPMPWVDPDYLLCTVYLYPSEAEAEEGRRVGGSGFVIGVPLDDKSSTAGSALFVVTNKHVVDDGNMVVRVNTIEDKIDTIALDGARWFFHPNGRDDVAICPLAPSANHRLKYISVSNFLDIKTIENLEIGPGDDVFIVGRFVNHEGRQRNLPSVRFGNIAQMPWEPIDIGGHLQESFLVEARSISGYSGSPVFIYLPAQVPPGINPEIKKMVREGRFKMPGVSSKRVDFPITMGPYLLGLNYCYIRWDEPVWNRKTGEPTNPDWFIKSNTGMMGVVPAWKIVDILEGKELKPFIDKAKADVVAAKNQSPVELTSSRDRPANDANPTHREDFTHLLGAAARKHPQDD